MTSVVDAKPSGGVAGPGPTADNGHSSHLKDSPSGLVNWLTSTDHKVIGISYMITSIAIFYLAGIMALLMRLQLASPHSSLLSFSQYNALFTMHGSLMLYLFAGPFAFGGLANYIVPLQVDRGQGEIECLHLGASLRALFSAVSSSSSAMASGL